MKCNYSTQLPKIKCDKNSKKPKKKLLKKFLNVPKYVPNWLIHEEVFIKTINDELTHSDNY